MGKLEVDWDAVEIALVTIVLVIMVVVIGLPMIGEAKYEWRRKRRRRG